MWRHAAIWQGIEHKCSANGCSAFAVSPGAAATTTDEDDCLAQAYHRGDPLHAAAYCASAVTSGLIFMSLRAGWAPAIRTVLCLEADCHLCKQQPADSSRGGASSSAGEWGDE